MLRREPPASPRFAGQRPALMVTPLPANLQVARRKPLAFEAQPLDELDRTLVTWLDVRLYTVEPILAKGQGDDLREPFPHVAVAGMRLKRVVAEKRRLRRSADD